MVKKKVSKKGVNGATFKKKVSATKRVKKKVSKKKAAPAGILKEVPIRRHVSPNEKTILANHVVVRSGQGTSQLFFFEIMQPLILDTDSDEIKKAAASQDHVDAHCVSRIAIPTHIVPGLIKALQVNLSKQQAAVAEAMADDPEAFKKAVNSAMGKKT